MKILKYISIASLFLIVILFISCAGDGGSSSSNSKDVISKKAGLNEVNIHFQGNPDKLNPHTSSNADATYVQQNIFQTLIDQDPVTYEYFGLLATSRPKQTLLNDGKYKGGVSYEFEIRPEAVWDNGTPITSDDYIFTIKAIKNPKVDAALIRPYYEFVKEIKVDPDNNKKFTVFLDSRYILGESMAGYWVYPEYIYDPEKIMRKFSMEDLCDPKKIEKLRTNADIVKFADQFNSEKFQREKGFVVGSGPYEFLEWKTGQYIELKRKENWWGDKITGPDAEYFTAGPDKIMYTIINDWTTAVTAMKDEELDLAKSIRAKDFVDLTKNKKFNDLYNLHTPDYMTYDFIGINMKDPKYTDKKVRQALNYLVDKDLIRDVIMYGYGLETVGPVHPSKTYYNKDLKPYNFNIEKAKQLLTEAGWKDTDGNGTIDKVINGKKTEFTTTIFYNQGNTRRENIALMFKENAKAAGIEVDVQVREFVVMMDLAKAHKFELVVSGWAGSTSLNDFKQIWHTESYNGGTNYVGFGNAETDQLIDEMRTNLDEPSRTEQYKKFQAILHEEAPYIFLNAHKNKLAFHKRFDNANAYIPRPGYDENEWLINPKFGFASSASSN